jgi:hypothetical protein
MKQDNCDEKTSKNQKKRKSKNRKRRNQKIEKPVDMSIDDNQLKSVTTANIPPIKSSTSAISTPDVVPIEILEESNSKRFFLNI